MAESAEPGRWHLGVLAGPIRADAGEAVISCRAAVGLGVALALNNLGTGLGAGVAGISPLATTLLAGALSLICVGGGSRLGWSAGRLVMGRWAQLSSGLILVGVGAIILSGAG